MTTDTDVTAEATQAIINTLREAGASVTGMAESGNLSAAFTFNVKCGGHDFNVEVAKSTITD